MLNMYEFPGGQTVYVCASTRIQAINLFKERHREDVWKEGQRLYGNNVVRRMHRKEMFIYQKDDTTKDKDTIENLIKKYCKEPRMFETRY